MKNSINLLSLIWFCLILSSCNSPTEEGAIDKENAKSKIEYNVVEIEGLYSIKIPKFMTVTASLQHRASLQYNNPFKEKYITVLDEKKDEITSSMHDDGSFYAAKSKLENFVELRLGVFAESGISISDQTELKSKKIDGCQAYSTTVEGSFPNREGVVYYFTFIEGDEKFYELKSWTLVERKDAYVEEVATMVNSFREL